MRRATQDAASIEQSCAIMKKGNNGGYANAWLVGDVNSGEIARLNRPEIHRFRAYQRRLFPRLQYRGGLAYPEAGNGYARRRYPSFQFARRVRWKQLMKENAGKIHLALGEKMEGDCYDTCLAKENPSSRSLSGHLSLDSESMAPGSGEVPFHPNGRTHRSRSRRSPANRYRTLRRMRAHRGKTLLLCHDAESNPHVDWASCRRMGVRSILVAPLRHFRRTLGLFEVLSSMPDAFDNDDVATMEFLFRYDGGDDLAPLRRATFAAESVGRVSSAGCARERSPASEGRFR